MAKPSYEEARKTVNEFMDQVIHGYAVGDLRRMGDLRPDRDSRNLRGCAIPEALTMFACLDLLGFLMRKATDKEENLANLESPDFQAILEKQDRGIDLSAHEKKQLKGIREEVTKSSSRNMKYMLQHWFRYSPLKCALIIELFRHGGAHQFLPKAAGIGKPGATYPLLYVRKNGEELPVFNLNVDSLRADFFEVVEFVTEIIREERIGGLESFTGEKIEDLVCRMSARLGLRNSQNKETLKGILEKHKSELSQVSQPLAPIPDIAETL